MEEEHPDKYFHSLLALQMSSPLSPPPQLPQKAEAPRCELNLEPLWQDLARGQHQCQFQSQIQSSIDPQESYSFQPRRTYLVCCFWFQLSLSASPLTCCPNRLKLSARWNQGHWHLPQEHFLGSFEIGRFLLLRRMNWSRIPLWDKRQSQLLGHMGKSQMQ